jgi:hypothetical protein
MVAPVTARRPRDGRAPYRPPVGTAPVMAPTGGPASMGVALTEAGDAVVVLIEHDGKTTTGALTWDQALGMARALIDGAGYAANRAGVAPRDFADAVINLVRALADGSPE